MGNVTKWAVETAKESMLAALRVKMAKWDKANPPKGRDVPRMERAEIAFNDPAWKAHVLGRVKRGYNDVDIRDSDFESHSPMLAAVLKKSEAVDAARTKARAEVESALTDRRDEIIRSAIIGDVDGAALLKAVNEFCKR